MIHYVNISSLLHHHFFWSPKSRKRSYVSRRISVCLNKLASSKIGISMNLKKFMNFFIIPPARRAWRSYKFAAFCFYSACRRRGGVLKCPRFWFSFSFFFRCRKLGCRTHVNSIFSGICRQNTRFNMYGTTSKQQEGCMFKDSLPKCFITTNFDKFPREAVAKGSESRWCFDSMFPWYTKSKVNAFTPPAGKKMGTKLTFIIYVHATTQTVVNMGHN